jgi:hypothetical protein
MSWASWLISLFQFKKDPIQAAVEVLINELKRSFKDAFESIFIGNH